MPEMALNPVIHVNHMPYRKLFYHAMNAFPTVHMISIFTRESEGVSLTSFSHDKNVNRQESIL
jgi:hypothetical protein